MSKREVGGFPKPGPMRGSGREFQESDDEQKYVKKSSIKIESDDQYMTTGSLFDRRKNSSFLIEDFLPVKKGHFLNIKLVPSIANQEKASEVNKQAAETPKTEPKDEDLKKIFDQLPQLDPGGNRDGLLSSLEMEVVDVSENGWATVEFKRKSASDKEQKEMSLTARIPPESLKDIKNITSKDLRTVKLESVDGKTSLERATPAWTDELTARVSGFSEAKSIYSTSLEEKRKELAKIRKDVDGKLSLLSKDRSQIAVTREKLRADRQQLNDKIGELEKTVAEKDDQIAKLTPVEQPLVEGENGEGDAKQKDKDPKKPEVAK
jgi:hypothetical protein